jgi:hypothetical protein
MASVAIGEGKTGEIAQGRQRDLRQLVPYVVPTGQKTPPNKLDRQPVLQRQAEPKETPDKQPSPPKQDISLDDMEA